MLVISNYRKFVLTLRGKSVVHPFSEPTNIQQNKKKKISREWKKKVVLSNSKLFE